MEDILKQTQTLQGQIAISGISKKGLLSFIKSAVKNDKSELIKGILLNKAQNLTLKERKKFHKDVFDSIFSIGNEPALTLLNSILKRNQWFKFSCSAPIK